MPSPVPPSVDWDDFIRLVQFHRIEGLVAQALRDQKNVPTFVTQQMTASAAAIAARNLQAAAESRRLTAAFRAANVPLLFVKGLTLGSLAYGNSVVKSAIDVDVLIDPVDLDKAAACLREAGFNLVAPRRSLSRWHRSWKESVWRSARSGLQLDFHTRLADNPHLIPTIDVHSPRQEVDVGSGIVLPTLADCELLTYLAVHGLASGWFRLKWIADFAALLSRLSDQDVVQFAAHSRNLGCGRAAGQALLLANALFGSLAALPSLVEEFEADTAVVRLLHIALALIDRAPSEPTERFLGTLPIHRSQFAAQPGVGFKLAHVWRKADQLFARLTV